MSDVLVTSQFVDDRSLLVNQLLLLLLLPPQLRQYVHSLITGHCHCLVVVNVRCRLVSVNWLVVIMRSLSHVGRLRRHTLINQLLLLSTQLAENMSTTTSLSTCLFTAGL